MCARTRAMANGMQEEGAQELAGGKKAAKGTQGEPKGAAPAGAAAAVGSAPPPPAAGVPAVSLRATLLCALLLMAYYLPIMAYTTRILYVSILEPKSAQEAGVLGFSEERAFAHVKKLAGDMGGGSGIRSEGSPGLVEGTNYLLETVLELQAKASKNLRVEVDVSSAYSGSFNLFFLQKSMTMGYQNLTNILVRVSAADAYSDAVPSVLVNGHYDSSVATPGAADCASCVATMLETLRQVVEGDVAPPSPLIFMFNGGEEIFLKAAHGFLTQHKWSETIGAFVNIEASGTRLPDLLVQSGAPWVQRVYAQSVPHPMGSVIAQDVFPHLPGDTDFRILAKDFDDMPGLDIMYILNGYAYHTMLDNPDSLQPGALQVRGENLLPLLLGLAKSPELMTRTERRMARWSEREREAHHRQNGNSSLWVNGRYATGAPAGEEDTVFFDVFYQYMIGYSKSTATALLSALLGLIVLSPSVASRQATGCNGPVARADQLVIGCLCYAASWLLAVLFPVLLSVARVWISGAPMGWYATPGIAYAAFVPVALVGILVPHAFRTNLLATDSTPLAMEKVEWSSHWGGVVACNALFCLAITALGGGSGYLMFWWAVFLTPSLYIFRRLQSLLGRNSPWCILAFLVPALVPSIYSLGFLQFVTQILVEKMGASGTHALPIGPFVPDVVVAVVVGLGSALFFAPLAGALSRWLARGPVLRVLLYSSLLAAISMSYTFPYSPATPKRLLLCRAYATQGPDVMLSAQTVIVTADANDVRFVVKHAPKFTAAFLASSPAFRPGHSDVVLPSGLPQGVITPRPGSLLSWYPISEMVDRPAAVPARQWQATERGVVFPHIRVEREEWVAAPEGQAHLTGPRRRVYLDFSTGSLKNVWSAVLNITGPLAGWSLAEGKLPAPEVSRLGGPPAYMLHLGGGGGSLHSQFWFEASSSDPLRVELAIMDQKVEEDLGAIARAAPDWMAGALYPVTSYQSVYSL